MTNEEALDKMRAALAEQHSRFVPDEKATQSRGQLGFDYGYQQALFDVEAKLYTIFPLTRDTPK